MISRWLSWLNSLILLIACLLVMGSLLIWLNRPKEISCSQVMSKNCQLPKSQFLLKEEAYVSIGEPVLELQTSPPTLQLPDLRNQLIYYGKNGRPDASSNRTLLHFSLNGSKTVVSVSPNEPLYFLYDKKSMPSHYVFSPNNEKTSLWIEATTQDTEAIVKAFMKTEKGELIQEPEQYHQFKLGEKEFIRYAGSTWEIGNWRVDGTLLARQRARWFGADRFLEKHGGQEYQQIQGKQRIEFGENEDMYSVFVAQNDCLIWDGKQWRNVPPSEESLNYPLLVVKKVDERLMSFELWDTEGKGRVLLNLLKSTEPWAAYNSQTIQHMFKFVGARTKTQCVFEINKERMLISPSDWLLLTGKGWKKLETEQEIDDYVKRKTPGTLFVFEGLDRKDERQVMLGVLYNTSRSDRQEVEIPIQQGGGGISKTLNKEPKDIEDDDRLESLTSQLENELPRVPPHPPVYRKDQPPTH